MQISFLGSEALEAVATDNKIELTAPRQEEKNISRRHRLAIIVAAGNDGAIGINGKMIWHIPADLRHFKEITTGGTVIMGRKTWLSLPKAPLPRRRNIVITRDNTFSAEGAEVFHSLEEATDNSRTDDSVFIIGGGEIYRQSMEMADTIYMTRIGRECEAADTHFPRIDPQVWRLTECSETMTTDEGIPYRFETWRR